MTPRIQELESKIEDLKKQLAQARQEAPPEKVDDYVFKTANGDVRLSELFGDNDDLLVVHNMGRSCNYCTMWADGLNGHLRHLERRASFVVVSPDTPEKQEAAKQERGWRFHMASDRGGSFTPDMGFKTENDGYWPGVSAFHRNPDGTLVRTGKAIFGPGDDFCPPWPLFDLLPGGSRDFEPD